MEVIGVEGRKDSSWLVRSSHVMLHENSFSVIICQKKKYTGSVALPKERLPPKISPIKALEAEKREVLARRFLLRTC